MIGEELYMYLSILPFTVSLILVKGDIGTQKPINYITKVLHGVEIRYAKVEKLVYALIILA